MIKEELFGGKGLAAVEIAAKNALGVWQPLHA